MKNTTSIRTNTCLKRLASGGLLACALALGALRAAAATHNVTSDPTLTWHGYEQVFTNGVINTTPPAYLALYLGAGGFFFNQSSVDPSGDITVAPDIWCDIQYTLDPAIWYDASGVSTSICKSISTIYTEDMSFLAGDTVTYSGILRSDTLAEPYRGSAIVFVKEFDAGWGWQGMSSLNLNTLTNGQTFSVSKTLIASGGHVQWGVEWAGQPARQADVLALGSATVGTNGVVTPPPPATTNYVYINHANSWVGYENYVNRGGLGGGWFAGQGVPAADVQGSINASGTVLCSPDIWVDKNRHTDTDYWYDASGASTGVCTVVSTYYVDSAISARAGDTVVFSGYFVTNGLAEPFSNSIVAFVKDFTAGWGYNGGEYVSLNTLTNGQQFTVSRVITATGGHVQWGFEWSGPPARTNVVASLGYAVLSSNAVASAGPQIAAITPNNANVIMGANQSFAATTIPSTGLTCQWRKNGVNLTDGGGISGATTQTLNLNSVVPSQEGTYSLVVTDSLGRKATNTAVMIVYNPAWLYYDRALAPLNGWMNVWSGAKFRTTPPPSGDAGTTPGSSFGFGVNPTTLLRASMDTTTDVITLRPNTYVYDGATNSMDPAFINPDGSPAAYMEQDFFIGADFLNGQTITFAGFCSSNSLNPAYTARAWIKDMNPDWSVERRYDVDLVAGKPWSITRSTIPGNHVQYGFAIWGPCNSATNPITSGAVELKVYSPIAATRAGTTMKLEFPTVINHQYAVLYKTNLTDGSWNTLVTTNGTGVKVTVPDPANAARRFYRLSTQ